jgi:hypothetical protein
MSVTAILVLAVYAGLIGLAIVKHPIYALFAYLFIFYNDPQWNWWGSELPAFRYSLMAALVGLLRSMSSKFSSEKSWISTGVGRVWLLYAVWVWIQLPWAVGYGIHIDGAILFTKYVALSFLIYRVIIDERTLRMFLWAHVAGCTLFGLRGLLMTFTGRLEYVGASGVDDSNLLAAHLITGMVTAGFLFVGSKGVQRWVAFGTLPFMMNAVILTQSRGGFLAMGAAGLCAWFFSPKKFRPFISVAIVLGGCMFLLLANEQFWERVSTIQESSQGENADTRVQILGPQFEMFKDHPWGAGYRGNALLSPKYMPPELLSNAGIRSAHNTFMAALVDQGIPGALLLLSFYVWGFITLLKLKRLDKQGLSVQFGIYRGALGASLGTCVIAGVFLNLMTFEVQIWLATLLASLSNLAHRSLKDAPAPVGAPGIPQPRPLSARV